MEKLAAGKAAVSPSWRVGQKTRKQGGLNLVSRCGWCTTSAAETSLQGESVLTALEMLRGVEGERRCRAGDGKSVD